MEISRNAFIGCDCGYEEAEAVIFGAPFDSTTSFRPGTRFGPSAMRTESFGIETYSPYQDKDITDFRIFDAGDIELPFGSPEKPLEMIESTAKEIIGDGKIPFLIGGEHLVTLGAVRAVSEKYGKTDIIHFDAHAVLRDDYLGVKLSHACVMRRCDELDGVGKIHQFCIRSGDRSEFVYAEGNTDMNKFGFDNLSETVSLLREKNVPVYFSIDLDCLDTSVFPGTGTPEAGGVSFCELLSAIKKVAECNVVAADICELAPMLDPTGASTAAACKVLRELLLSVLGNKKERV